jgi:hypothetical protein
MRRILTLAVALAVLVGGGVAMASPTGSSQSHAGKTGKAPVVKSPRLMMMPGHCHHGLGMNTASGL